MKSFARFTLLGGRVTDYTATEGAVVLTVVGNKYGDCGAAFAGLVRVAHLDQSTSQ